MKKILSLNSAALAMALSLFSVPFFAPATAHAASCEAKAASVARSRGGRVLSVRTVGSTCRIKILVKSRGGAPKRITVNVRK